MYHYRGRISDVEHVEGYLAIHDGSLTSVSFRPAATTAKAERRHLVGPVMASPRLL